MTSSSEKRAKRKLNDLRRRGYTGPSPILSKEMVSHLTDYGREQYLAHLAEFLKPVHVLKSGELLSVARHNATRKAYTKRANEVAKIDKVLLGIDSKQKSLLKKDKLFSYRLTTLPSSLRQQRHREKSAARDFTFAGHMINTKTGAIILARASGMDALADSLEKASNRQIINLTYNFDMFERLRDVYDLADEDSRQMNEELLISQLDSEPPRPSLTTRAGRKPSKADTRNKRQTFKGRSERW